VARPVKDRGGAAALHQLAGVDHAEVVAELRYHAEIGRDEQHRQAEFLDKVAQKIEDLLLVVTSSAVVGSSAMTSAGAEASAAAITRRCRWPPENWCG
jgi:hypothetical protein